MLRTHPCTYTECANAGTVPPEAGDLDGAPGTREIPHKAPCRPKTLCVWADVLSCTCMGKGGEGSSDVADMTKR